jgi:L-threonylcarbamoyladenylate synthase
MTEEELSLAISALSRGAVVAAATETFFGLLADARQARALDAIFALKGRARDKGVALLVANRADWSSLVVEIPALAETLAAHFWPGPLTLALPSRPNLDPRLTVDGTVAVRQPGPSDAARIVAAFGAPLTATSANRAGAPPCVTSADVESAFAEALTNRGLVLVRGTAPGGEPSTLLAVTEHDVRVVRSGRIKESEWLPFVPASNAR